MLFILLVTISYMYKWMMSTCLFCIWPSFWALLLMFQWLPVCLSKMNSHITHWPKILHYFSGQSPHFWTWHVTIFFIYNRYEFSISPISGAVEQQGYINKQTRIPAIKKLTFRRNLCCVLAHSYDFVPISFASLQMLCTSAILN